MAKPKKVWAWRDGPIVWVFHLSSPPTHFFQKAGCLDVVNYKAFCRLRPDIKLKPGEGPVEVKRWQYTDST